MGGVIICKYERGACNVNEKGVEKHNTLVFVVDINLKSKKRDTVEKFRLHPLVVLFL